MARWISEDDVDMILEALIYYVKRNAEYMYERKEQQFRSLIERLEARRKKDANT